MKCCENERNIDRVLLHHAVQTCRVETGTYIVCLCGIRMGNGSSRSHQIFLSMDLDPRSKWTSGPAVVVNATYVEIAHPNNVRHHGGNNQRTFFSVTSFCRPIYCGKSPARSFCQEKESSSDWCGDLKKAAVTILESVPS
jgi:hypothetical protein